MPVPVRLLLSTSTFVVCVVSSFFGVSSALSCSPGDSFKQMHCETSFEGTPNAAAEEEECKCVDGKWTPACFSCEMSEDAKNVEDMEIVNTEEVNGANAAQLAQPFRTRTDTWTEMHAEGAFGSASTTKAEFDAAFAVTGVAVRVCADCRDSHKTIVYKRTSNSSAAFSAHDNFFETWSSDGFGPNQLHRDFELYSSPGDMDADTNRWNFCNYNDWRWRIGFPRDCDPTRFRAYQWQSVLHGSTRRHIAWFVKKDSSSGAAPTPTGGLPGVVESVNNATDAVADAVDASVDAGNNIAGEVDELADDVPSDVPLSMNGEVQATAMITLAMGLFLCIVVA